MKKILAVLIVTIFCFAFSNSKIQKRVVRENEFDVHCYISLKKVRFFENNKMYYWYKSGGIHQSVASIGGNALHKDYIKYYRSNQLAEQGKYNYGLKTGVWKTWHTNGQVDTKEQWYDGFLQGEYMEYNSNGKLITKGKYNNNLKVGTWVNYTTNDTIYYKKDVLFKEKPETLLDRVFYKKDSLEKAQIKLDRITKNKAKARERAKIKFEKAQKKRNDSIKRAYEKSKTN